jgi:hypothetical protein
MFFLAQTEVVLPFRKEGGKTLYKGRSMFLVYEEKTFQEKKPLLLNRPTQSFGATTGVATPSAKAR